MDCWHVVDDLNFINLILTEEMDRSDPMSEDELYNLLLGMETMYQRRFDRLFGVFEDLVERIHITDEELELVKRHREYDKKMDDMFDYEDD
jgi:hypothetical protein